ncbi:MAG: PhoH family protein [Acidimicrobiales bacterium]|nr:PhoH family protein [Acidimicrobiales bacterium]
MTEPTAHAEQRRTYVLDTSVLLADAMALERFDGHDVVLPLVVLSELEDKRHHGELGYMARAALRYLEGLRTRYGSLTEPMPLDHGGTLRIELNHVDGAALPGPMRDSSNDARILAVADSLAREGLDVVVVTKDLPLRLKASILGLGAEEYRNELAPRDEWTGMVDLDVSPSVIDELYAEGVVDLDQAGELPVHAGLVLRCGGSSALARLHPDKRARLLHSGHGLFGVMGRSAEQRVALDLLDDPEVGIVSLGGPAGTGKSVLALAAGLDAVMNRRTHKRIVVFRPLFAVGGQDLGYLPGSESEKMAPWGAAVMDALESITSPAMMDRVVSNDLIEVLPLTHIRGRTLVDTWVILDEAQQYERPVLVTALSRLGQGSRVVLTHDIAQRDNLRVGRYDGVMSVISALTGDPLFAHVTLSRSERSPIAALAASILELPTGGA